MSSQIQITGETKVKSLTGVLVGTSGVVSSLNIDGSLGIPQLDVNGKILVSQLPNSVMEYKGTWDASTNTPTLVNGTGNQGDVYLCSVAGTVNFGAGAISFVVSDQVIYSGSIWQKASGSNGTVTSVAVTESGDALTITGSPITTSGTINIGFAGTNLQYVNGAGNLTTFPTLISSIGLSMPSAFSVSNSPLTANGTIAVTGAGYPSQYIRGDGTLADFPTSGGGGSSVSYYLNGGTSQGTIGGVTYYEMSKTADTGTGVDFTKSGDGFIVAFLTDAGDPAQLNIPAGNWNYEIYASMSANGGTPEMYAELYKYDGTTFTLISTSSNEILYDGTALNLYTFAMTVPSTTLAITDRLAVKLYATNSGGKTTTVHTQDSHLCQIITTFSTGITALNGLTAQVQYFATGTSGTDFNISSTTATHTFNIPDASATNRGLITTGTQTIAGAKTFSGGVTANSYYAQGNGTQGGYLYLKQGIVPYSTLTGSNSISADGTKYIFFSDAGSYNGKIALFELGSLTNNTNRTYTLPDASGTIALTSNLSSYLPLAGGIMTGSILLNNNLTISGQLFGTSSYASMIAMSPSDKVLIDNSGRGVIFGGTIGQGAYTYTFPAATGTLALLSGTQTFTGATTFSSDLLVSGLTIGRGGSAVVGNTAIGAGTLAANTTGVFNTAIGYYALASNTIGVSNTAIGANSLLVNTTGNNNTSIGTDSLNVNTTGSRNTAIGYYALNANTTANNNAAIGYYTLVNNTTGAENLGVGNEALRFNTLGNNNVAIGNESLRLNTTGTSNTSIGVGALYSNTTGGNNIAIGYNSATSITTGSNNTIIGGYVGTAAMANNIVLADGAGTIRYQWNGTNNVFSNPISGTSATFKVNADRNLAIKYDTNVTLSSQGDSGGPESLRVFADTFRIFTGTTAGGLTERFTIGNTGNVGIGMGGYGDMRLVVRGAGTSSATFGLRVEDSSANALFQVRNDGLTETGTQTNSPYNISATGRTAILSSSGVLGYLVSTRESKANIESIKNIDFINKLNPVQFNYRKKDYTTNEFTDELYDNITYGFIADEVEKVNKELVFYNSDGTTLAGVDYNSMIAILTKAIQEQQAIITSLQDRLDKLENK